MRIVTILAAAAVATSLACTEGVDPGQIGGPEFAKGKPDLNTEQVCEVLSDTEFFTSLAALCAQTDDEATEFNSRNHANRDRWGLIAKLNRAGQKCSVDGDVAGAIGKLTEFMNKVFSLRAEEKISEPAGGELFGGAQALIDSFPRLTCPSGAAE